MRLNYLEQKLYYSVISKITQQKMYYRMCEGVYFLCECEQALHLVVYIHVHVDRVFPFEVMQSIFHQW